MAFSNNTDTPIFVQNQILRADDLNAMVKYFEEQVRLTRIFTIGIGARGLEINYNDDTHIFTISTGLGISSDGILFQLDQPCEFTHYKKVEVSKRAFYCINGSREACSSAREPIDVLELFTSQEQDTLPLSGLDQNAEVKDFCVVLLHCEDVVSRKSCFNDCEQSGADQFSKTRVLLVPETVLNPIGEGEEENTNVLVNIKPPPSIHRLGYIAGSGINLSAIDNWEKLYQAYYSLIDDSSRDTIAEAISSSHSEFYNKILPSEDPFLEALDLLNNLASRYEVVNPPNLSDIQYFYAFFRDLVLAYDEFYKATCGLSVGVTVGREDQGNNVLCAFPGYVALGRFRNNDNAGCRTNFIPAAASKEVNERQLRAEKLYRRLIDLFAPSSANEKELNLDLKPGELSIDPDIKKEIHITGSCIQKSGLSQQAIPYYFKLEGLQNNWNAENPNCNLQDFITHYDLSILDSNSLHKKLDIYDFYRIERHLGKDLLDVEQQVRTLQLNLNVPFDVRPLLLGPGLLLEPALQDDLQLYGGEMQEVYQNTRADILCKLDEFVEASGPLADQIQQFYNELEEYGELGFVPKDSFPTLLQEAINEATGQFEVLQDSLKNLQPIFLKLIDKYDKAIEEIKKAITFTGFAELHPGMEHLGGVPSGGTFIPVYAFRFTSSLSKTELAERFQVDDSLTDERILFEILAKEITGEDLRVLQRNLRKIVVADFCLPYSCCSNSPVIRYQFEQPNLQLFVVNSFCFDENKEEDDNTINYTLSPEGGTLSIFINDAVSEAIIENNAGVDQSLNLKDLLAIDEDFGDNGKASIKIQYLLGSQQIEEVITIYKKPDLSKLLCEKGEPIINQEGIWVGFKYSFVHGLIDAEVERATLRVGHLSEQILDISIPSVEKEIRTDQEDFRLPIEVSLYAENGSCKDSETKIIEQKDFCKEASLELFGGCVLTGQEVEGKLVLNGIKCPSSTITPDANGDYELIRNEEHAFVRFTPDCPGGTFTIKQVGDPLVGVNENFPQNLLIQTAVPLDQERSELVYLFIFNAVALSDQDAGLLGVEQPGDLQFVVSESVTFALTYTPPTPCADNQLEFSITITVPGEPDPIEEEEDPEERRDDDDDDDGLAEDVIVVASPSPASAPQELSKAASTLLNARSSELRKQLTALESDRGLARTKVFGLSKSFLILPAKDLTTVNARFEELSKSLNASLSRAKDKRKADLQKIVSIVLRGYLDKQVTLSPTALPTETETMLKALLPKWKKLGFKIGPVKKTWKASALKKALPAPAIDQIQKRLK